MCSQALGQSAARGSDHLQAWTPSAGRRHLAALPPAGAPAAPGATRAAACNAGWARRLVRHRTPTSVSALLDQKCHAFPLGPTWKLQVQAERSRPAQHMALARSVRASQRGTAYHCTGQTCIIKCQARRSQRAFRPLVVHVEARTGQDGGLGGQQHKGLEGQGAKAQDAEAQAPGHRLAGGDGRQLVHGGDPDQRQQGAPKRQPGATPLSNV